MNVKLMFVPDTHVVVPKKTDSKQLENCGPIEGYDCDRTTADKDHSVWYEAMLQEAPQLTTPPVLRWEGQKFMVGNKCLAVIFNFWNEWFIEDGADIGVYYSFGAINEARRAAEKALGFPDGLVVEEV